MPLDPFHRLESPTQTRADAREQVRSGEIWGRAARGSHLLAVKAYPGLLPTTERGIQFTTAVDPYPGGSPFEAHWYHGVCPGVLLRHRAGDDFACIPAAVTNRQP